MAQNIYDDETFFTGYSKLLRSRDGLDGAPEWPTLQSMLPDNLAGQRVVDLGCGFGWFCRWAAEAGASSVLGIDLSTRMLDRATSESAKHRAVSYEQADLDDLDELDLGPRRFDLAYSSLTFHYLTDLHRVLATVAQSLTPAGKLVFSVEHPIFTAPTNPAFTAGADGTTVWPLDGYLDEGARITNWLAPGVVKQHRTIGSYVSALHHAGFLLTDLVEWGPSPEQIQAHPGWAFEVDRPPFLLISAELGLPVSGSDATKTR